MNLDFIPGIPRTRNRADIAQRTFRSWIQLPVSHVSLYSLTYEPDTPLARLVRRTGEAELNSPEKDEQLWFTGVEELKRRGYVHYEVSNFCTSRKRMPSQPSLLEGWSHISGQVRVQSPRFPLGGRCEGLEQARAFPPMGKADGVLQLSNPRDISAATLCRPGAGLWGAELEAHRARQLSCLKP